MKARPASAKAQRKRSDAQLMLGERQIRELVQLCKLDASIAGLVRRYNISRITVCKYLLT